MINWKIQFKNGEIQEGETGGFTYTLNKNGGLPNVSKVTVQAYGQTAEVDLEERNFKVTNVHDETEFLPFVNEGTPVEIVYYTKVNMLLDAGFQPINTTKVPRIGVKNPGKQEGAIVKLNPDGQYERLDKID